jgi:hypothetical protein
MNPDGDKTVYIDDGINEHRHIAMMIITIWLGSIIIMILS